MVRGRAYFALQAAGGAAWWIAVALSPAVRTATLGALDPLPIAVLDVPLFVVASLAAGLGVRPAAWVSTVWTCLVAVALAGYATLTGEAGWGVVVMAGAAGGSVLALALVVLGSVPTRWLAVGPFAFRPARSRSAGAHAIVTVLQIVPFWGFFLVAVPLLLRALESRWRLAIEFPPAATLAGTALLVLASASGLWSAAAMSLVGHGTPLPMATASRLVLRGPYRFVRNPMAVAGIAQGVAVGLLLSSWLVVGYALVGAVVWDRAVRPLEEADLEARFGDDFRRYRDAVRCWAPRVPPPRVLRRPALPPRGSERRTG